jgi:hypothetical protein
VRLLHKTAFMTLHKCRVSEFHHQSLSRKTSIILVGMVAGLRPSRLEERIISAPLPATFGPQFQPYTSKRDQRYRTAATKPARNVGNDRSGILRPHFACAQAFEQVEPNKKNDHTRKHACANWQRHQIPAKRRHPWFITETPG